VDFGGAQSVRVRRRPRTPLTSDIGSASGLVTLEAIPLPKVANNIGALPDRPIRSTPREFLGRATALATTPNAIPVCSDPMTDPICALIGEEKRWRLLAVTGRAMAERFLFGLPKHERPADFDDHPSMAEALSLEKRADEVYSRILETPASTLAGILTKLEWGEGDADLTVAAIADLRRWLKARS